MQGVRAPKSPRHLPKALSVEQAQQLLESPAAEVPEAVRDRAMFELLYSSGLRLAELVALDADDGRLDLNQGEVTVTGKGGKPRTVPVGGGRREELRDWLKTRALLAAPQEMLGHASISSTQVYTYLDFQALAKVYDAAHPRARKK